MNETPQTDAHIVVGHTYASSNSPLVPASLSRGIEVQRNELLLALERLIETPCERSLYDYSKEELAAWEHAEKIVAKTRRTLNEPL